MIPENALRGLTLANPWWKNEPIPPHLTPHFERPLLAKIRSYENLHRIIVVKGPRRTGKTTLLYQYISQLLKQEISPNQILFASFDDLSLHLPLQEVLDTFQSLTSVDYSKPTYIFFDEIQFLANWSNMAKVITDRNPQIHLVVSGSSSSLLIRSSESLTGRTIEEILMPFSPREIFEYQHPKLLPPVNSDLNLVDSLQFQPQLVSFKPQIEQILNQYVHHGGFPHLFSQENNETLWLELFRNDIIQKAIYKDITDLYKVKDPSSLEKLFLFLVSATSGILNVTSASQQLQLNRALFNQYLQYLKNTYLLFSLPKYSLYPKEILKSQEKIHISDPGLALLASQSSYSAILESTVISLILRRKPQNIYYWRDNYEIDCVVQTENQLLPIEIKSTNHLPRLSDLRGLTNFMQRYKVQDGFVIYNGEHQILNYPYGQITLLPAWFTLINL